MMTAVALTAIEKIFCWKGVCQKATVSDNGDLIQTLDGTIIKVEIDDENPSGILIKTDLRPEEVRATKALKFRGCQNSSL